MEEQELFITLQNHMKSWMIGDGENDVLAGKNAGCKTVLIGNQDYQQDYTVSSLKEFVDRML